MALPSKFMTIAFGSVNIVINTDRISRIVSGSSSLTIFVDDTKYHLTGSEASAAKTTMGIT